VAAGKIFICYRREDSAGHAGRLYDRLNQRFPGRVFMDVAGISVGNRWAEVIERTLRSCEVSVILIGRRWLERRPDGTRRLDELDDPLRAEIATAIRLKLKIVPLLVGGAVLPAEEDLVPDVAPIRDWQALRIDDEDFDHDSARLVQALEQQLGDERSEPHLGAAARKAEVRRLVANAEAAIERAEWITASQTLRAALSLDRDHAQARERLRFVQEQSAIPAPAPFCPAPPSAKTHSGWWAALGILGAVTLLGMVGVLGMLVTLGSMAPSTSYSPPEPLVHESPASIVPTPEPVKPEPVKPEPVKPEPVKPEPVKPEPAKTPVVSTIPVSVQETAVHPELEGDYSLISYARQGMMLPLNGAMRLIRVGEARYQFETVVTNNALGATFQYRGYVDGRGSSWTTAILQTNDPTALAGPIPTEVRFDGSSLAMQSAYGDRALWRKE
jgi:hypothetical protein